MCGLNIHKWQRTYSVCFILHPIRINGVDANGSTAQAVARRAHNVGHCTWNRLQSHLLMRRVVAFAMSPESYCRET